MRVKKSGYLQVRRRLRGSEGISGVNVPQKGCVASVKLRTPLEVLRCFEYGAQIIGREGIYEGRCI